MIIIVERELDAIHGHEHTQIRAIRRLVPDAPTCVVTHRKFTGGRAFSDDTIQPVLSTRRDIRYDYDNSLKADAQALLKVAREYEQSGKTAVLVPTSYAYEIRLVLAAFDHGGKSLRVVLRVIRPEAIEPLSQGELAKLRDLQNRGVISVHTETRELSKKLEDEFGLTAFDNFLLTCSVEPTESPIAEKTWKRNQGLFRVGYLGKNREEKGSVIVPDILRELAKRLPESDPRLRIDLVLQRPAKVYKDRAQISYVFQMYKALRSQSAVRLRWHKPSLPPTEFRKLVGSLDVMLVPYQKEIYQFCGSGVIADSVSAGVPIVHSAGMGMQSLLTHGNAFAAMDAPEFACRVLDALRHGKDISDNLAAAQGQIIAQLDQTRSLLRNIVEA